jgi:hypothetical protein
LKDIAIELRNMGIADLWVEGAEIPGAFRRPEEVIALAVRGEEPDPRILSAMPAVLAWNKWDHILLIGFGRKSRPPRRVLHRLAWLADVALAIDRRRGFPGRCRRGPLIDLVRLVGPPKGEGWDSLGRPMIDEPRSPVWRRWKIRYDATLSEFEERAEALADLVRRAKGSRPNRGGSGDGK